MLAGSILFSLLVVSPPKQLPPYVPSDAELKANYARADQWVQGVTSRIFLMQLTPVWLEQGKRFWYRADRGDGSREFILVDSATGAKRPAFDHAKLLAAWKVIDSSAKTLPFTTFEYKDPNLVYFEAQSGGWEFNQDTGELKKVAARERQRPRPNPPWRENLYPPDTREITSPDGNWIAHIKDLNVYLHRKGEEDKAVTTDGTDKAYYARVSWSPDSKRLVATRVTPGDRKEVHLIESSPADGGRAKLHSRVYVLPGDKVDTFDHLIVDVEKGVVLPSKAETIDYDGMPNLRWIPGTARYTYEKVDRGYGRFRIIEVDAMTGETKTLIDDDPDTFFDTTSHTINYLTKTREAINRSEKDGYGHLYLVDLETGTVKNQITKGPWVVRGVSSVDEGARQIVFMASGMEPGQDPYYIHYYRINFDGTGLTRLTEGDGNHEATFSPDKSVLVDTWSRVDKAPVHELRSAADGKLIARLEEADISSLNQVNYKAPERFAAKGRDGKTDIYGIVIRPSNFDPKKRYAVIEDIYAGPHDSFVPKSMRGFYTNQAVAELGFVVVRIDGMGTRNRGKAFHDIAYKNIADAGFPDRILWMKALAQKYPSIDISRVGIYGTSAGGQESTAGVLFHPEFYKVAVSSCGCHDNRMDKIWWNEQWMGPMGTHYAEQSNITNAKNLKGNLLLMVGEMDENVPPESTYRLADALIKANKEFELVVLPGANHTSGGAYGERKRRDFFVRHLLGVKTPDWNR
ncbi:MAG: prolyl oligopeptidase family serine peptidase [Fimbriimonas sp.]